MSRLAQLLFVLCLSCSQAYTQQIYTYAGNGTCASYTPMGAALSASLCATDGITADTLGNIYFATSTTDQVWKINTSGIISLFAGSTQGYSGDAALAINAQLNSPIDVEADTLGNVYIVDQGNHCIRKVDNTGVITTFAGIGIAGYSGDGGYANQVKLNSPSGIGIDRLGNVFISDQGNHRVRKINTLGIINTFAGSGLPGFTGTDGLAVNARINGPQGITADNLNNIYFADRNNNRVAKVNLAGILTSYAGVGSAGFGGDGLQAIIAYLNYPYDVNFDKLGNLLIADRDNQRIRKVNQAGIISTFAGMATAAYGGDGGPAQYCLMNYPSWLTCDKNGDIYIADNANNRVRKICYSNCFVGVRDEFESEKKVDVYPNPCNDKLFVKINSEFIGSSISIWNNLGQLISVSQINNQLGSVNLQELLAGLYFVEFNKGNKNIYRCKIMVEH